MYLFSRSVVAHGFVEKAKLAASPTTAVVSCIFMCDTYHVWQRVESLMLAAVCALRQCYVSFRLLVELCNLLGFLLVIKCVL